MRLLKVGASAAAATIVYRFQVVRFARTFAFLPRFVAYHLSLFARFPHSGKNKKRKCETRVRVAAIHQLSRCRWRDWEAETIDEGGKINKGWWLKTRENKRHSWEGRFCLSCFVLVRGCKRRNVFTQDEINWSQIWWVLGSGEDKGVQGRRHDKKQKATEGFFFFLMQ